MHLLLTPLKHTNTKKHIMKCTICMATTSVISPWATTCNNSKQNLNFWWPTGLTHNIFPWWGHPNIKLLLWIDWQFIWDSKGLLSLQLQSCSNETQLYVHKRLYHSRLTHSLIIKTLKKQAPQIAMLCVCVRVWARAHILAFGNLLKVLK
jgi:hypothetical protein